MLLIRTEGKMKIIKRFLGKLQQLSPATLFCLVVAILSALTIIALWPTLSPFVAFGLAFCFAFALGVNPDRPPNGTSKNKRIP
jgi:hypothetical protein